MVGPRWFPNGSVDAHPVWGYGAPVDRPLTTGGKICDKRWILAKPAKGTRRGTSYGRMNQARGELSRSVPFCQGLVPTHRPLTCETQEQECGQW